MKPDAPEKIYVRSEAIFKALHKRRKESDIEYTRTDVLKGISGGNDGVSLIMKERQRQIEVEGYDETHDSHHTPQVLARAAVAYALFDDEAGLLSKAGESLWPWGKEFWKPKDQKRNLIRAGALIAAALDKLNADNAPCKFSIGDRIRRKGNIGDEVGHYIIDVKEGSYWCDAGVTIPLSWQDGYEKF